MAENVILLLPDLFTLLAITLPALLVWRLRGSWRLAFALVSIGLLISALHLWAIASGDDEYYRWLARRLIHLPLVAMAVSAMLCVVTWRHLRRPP
jgi:hypothetical protein